MTNGQEMDWRKRKRLMRKIETTYKMANRANRRAARPRGRPATWYRYPLAWETRDSLHGGRVA